MRSDLDAAALAAHALAEELHVPPVLVGALAMAAHGYSRETHDVDIALVTTVSAATVATTIEQLGLVIRARHGAWGLDLRTSTGARVDVLLGFPDLPDIIPALAQEAVQAGRVTELAGQEFLVASVGFLFVLKLIAERAKDRADIVELMKALIELNEWDRKRADALATVRHHLGWYAVAQLERAEKLAHEELAR